MATMADVAKRAGVSLSTVSYTLSGERPISDATRERVLRAMAELDFEPNALARGLAAKRSGIVALLLPTDETEADPFMAEMIVGVAEAARRSNHHMLLWTEPADEAHQIVGLARQGLIDGALLMSVRWDDSRVAALADAGVPFTLVGRTADSDGVDYVDADEAQAVELAIRHLVELGHRSIAFLGPPAVQLEARFGIMVRIVDGLVAHAERAEIELSVHSCERTPASGRSLIRHVVQSAPDTTAAIVMNDPALGGVLEGLAELDRSVPSAFSVVGLFTTVLAAELTRPRLTTVAPTPRRIGHLAAEALIGSLNDPDRPPVHQLVEASLSIRDSTARATTT